MTLPLPLLLGVLLALIPFESPAEFQPGPPLLNRPATFVDLAYPTLALADRLNGTVVVEATLDAEGRVTDASAVSGPAALKIAAAANLRLWTFTPDPRRRAVVVYRFEIEIAECNEPARSFFRIRHGNLAMVSACQQPGSVGTPGGGLDPPVVAMPRPSYPPIAHNARFSGLVVLAATVDGQGRVEEVTVLSSRPLLDQRAANNLRGWRFERGTRRTVTVVYEFDSSSNTDCRFVRDDSPWLHLDSDHVPAFIKVSACGPLVQV